MTYATLEAALETGQPVETYKFLVGATPHLFTSAEDSVTVGSETFSPTYIERAKVGEGSENRENSLKVTIETSNPIAQLFTLSPPGVRVSVEIRRYHRTDTPTPEVIRIFDGFVMSAQYVDNAKRCRLACRPAISVLSRVVPRFTYHSACNHVLYDDGCAVDDTDPAFRLSNAAVTGVSGNDITVTGVSSFGTDWFVGGFISSIGTTDFRLVLAQSGDTLTLLLPFTVTPSVVDVFAGCAHDIETCDTKFDNVERYGGFAFTPARNPFEGVD